MKLDPHSAFTIDELETIADHSNAITLNPKSRARIEKASRLVQKLALSDKPIYGVNTGFGKLAEVRISSKDLVKLQLNLIRSHAAGMGAPLLEGIVRRLLLLRVISLGKGYS